VSSDSDGSSASTESNSPRNRPSTLHGLKNKVKLAIGSSRTTSPVTSLRRQSFHAVPPSPLTRTLPPPAAAVSPAATSTSPPVTRSLSPLVGGHCLMAAGISNLSQSYSPAASTALSRNSLSAALEGSLSAARRRSASPESLKVNQGHERHAS